MKLTDFERQLLKRIKFDCECGWEDENGDYTYTWNLFYKTKNHRDRGVLSSLVKKNIIEILTSEQRNDVIHVLDVKYFDLVEE